MTTTGNLPPNEFINSTTDYFNNYFTSPLTTSPNINDAAIGFFQELTGDASSGKILAATVIQTALQNGIDPMSLVDEFKILADKNKNLPPPPTWRAGVLYSQGMSVTYSNAIYKAITSNQNTEFNVEEWDYISQVPTQQNNSNELNAYLTVLLNSNRVGTSLLGLSNSPEPNKYVIRAVLP